jgi:hypothetical protein
MLPKFVPHYAILYILPLLSFSSRYFVVTHHKCMSLLQRERERQTVFLAPQSVQRLATGWTVRRSNPGGGEIFRTRPDRTLGPPSPLYNGYRVLPGSKAAGALTTHPIWRRGSRKSIAMPLLHLWYFED